jgi:hypothetical protein
MHRGTDREDAMSDVPAIVTYERQDFVYGSEGIRTLDPTRAGLPASNRLPSSTRSRFRSIG